MDDRDSSIIERIAKYIVDVESYIKGMEFDAFMQDSKTMAVTAFALSQI